MQAPKRKPCPAKQEADFQNPHVNFKRFPAYGKQLDDLRKQNLIPAQRVIVAFDWSIGKLYPRIIVKPDAPVSNLQFRYLAGLHVQIAYYDHDAIIMSALVDEILRIHPASLAVFNMSAVTRGGSAFSMIHMEGAYNDI